MGQDGKVDEAGSAPHVGGSSAGSIMLTLCSPSDGVPGYRHAMIPFPSSYETACLEALKTFAAYIPARTEAVSLRQAVKRMDGECVWSIIREDAWDTILRRDGEELGVFLPDVTPERYGYKKPSKKLVCFRIQHGPGSYSAPFTKPVYSLKECQAYAKTIKPKKWDIATLHFDQRILGAQGQKTDYTDTDTGSDSPGKKDPILSPLGDSELFDQLVGLYSEGMVIYLSRSSFRYF